MIPKALFEECFPGLPAGIEKAAALGADWQAISTPFVVAQQSRPVAHVGAIAHPMRLDGRDVTVGGIHAVCTAADRRRQGLARRALSEALDWIDERFDLVKLHTDLPAVYEPHGFRVVPTHRFRTPPPESATPGQRLLRPTQSPADAALLRRMLRTRTPPSDTCSAADPGWMDTTVACLNGTIDSAFWLLEDHEAIVAFGHEGGTTLILDVIAERLPSAAVVVGAAPDATLPIEWTFAPDRFGIEPEALPAPPEAGSLMVRGDWPRSQPFGISPLWEH